MSSIDPTVKRQRTIWYVVQDGERYSVTQNPGSRILRRRFDSYQSACAWARDELAHETKIKRLTIAWLIVRAMAKVAVVAGVIGLIAFCMHRFVIGF